MRSQIPDYWPMLKAYHRARESLYRAIIADCALPHDALILDAACGDAFYSHLIANVLGPRARIVALDRNLAVLQAQPGPNESVALCLSDIERAGLRQHCFDVVWLCRMMHSALDPQQTLSALVPLLRSGGQLIVIENDLAHCPVLSWSSRFEQRVQLALDQFLQEQCRNGAAIDRYYAARHLPTWLAGAGVRRATLHTYPIEDVAPMATEIETYWKLLMSLRGQMIRPFLSTEDWQTYSRAFDSDSPDYVLTQPGFYCFEPTTVACGIAP